MVTVPVDMSKCYSVDADGAQIQSLGSTTAAVFSALPGEEGDYTVRIGTDSFETTGVIMAMAPGTIDDLNHIKDLKEGMILKGTVRNVIDFGAFVDIGVHQDGLVHISQMSEKFIKHPLEAVSVGDVVEVRVLGVDEKKNRISLSMKGLNK